MFSYQKNFTEPTMPVDEAQFFQLVRASRWAGLIEQFRQTGDQALKRKLPAFIFQSTFDQTQSVSGKPGCWRKQSATRLTGLVVMDVDHIDEPLAKYEAWKSLDFASLGILLVYVTPSGKGLKVVFKADEAKGNLIDNQHAMASILSVEADEACKDASRLSFICKESDILYLDKELFTYENRAFAERYDNAYREGKSSATKAHEAAPGPKAAASEAAASEHTTPSFKGIPYASIVSEWWCRNGGEPAEGERNVKLHQLAVNLRSICDNKKELLLAVMPRLGLSEQELKGIVDSACKESPKGISKAMQAVIAALEDNEAAGESEESTITSTTTKEEETRIDPGTLPIGLRESLIGVPEAMHMPVLCAVLPIAAAYADQVEAEYCDGNRQRLGLMSIIHGDQASGKSVCKSTVDIWKRTFDEEDAEARRREEEWRERKKGRKANEKAPEDPKVLIRTVPVTVSCSTLLRRFKNARGHCLYSFGEELDTLRKTNGAGSWSSKYDIYRLAFDNGEWGQDYNSDAAESGVVRVAYNWTMLGTNGALQKCFKSDNIENGLSSRILIAEMPDSSFEKMPKFGSRSASDESRIQQAVARLRAASGFVDTPRLRAAIEEWVEQKRVEAAKDIDHVKDTYRKRAAVIGFRAGIIFHLLTGKQHEDEACLDFATTMADYTLQGQIAAFGEALQSQWADTHGQGKRYSNYSVFDRLPPVFTMDNVRTLKRGHCSDASMRTIISRWTRDGWIEKADAKQWRKTKAKV